MPVLCSSVISHLSLLSSPTTVVSPERENCVGRRKFEHRQADSPIPSPHAALLLAFIVCAGVNAYKSLCRDARMLPAGGAPEIELSMKLSNYARKQSGLEQYAIAKYAEALEVVPRTLAENSGSLASDVLSKLYAAHAGGEVNTGVDVDEGKIKDLSEMDVYDLYSTKWWALKFATEAAVTVMRVDQIIMAKQAGGPKPRGGPGDDDD